MADPDRQRLRQDLQDEQDEFAIQKHSPDGECLVSDSILFFHPVNPVHPVKIQYPN
jgi:hypothetical protein